MKGIQTTKWYCRGRPSPRQAKIMGEKIATSPEAIHSRIAKRDSKPYRLAIREWWRDNPRRCSHIRIKYPQLTPWPHWCGCDPWTGWWGPQQLTEHQKEWLMRRALEDRHGWLTSVGGGWIEERNITTETTQRKEANKKKREAQKQGGPEKGSRPLCDREGLAHSRPRARGLFSLGCWAARFCVFFTPKTSRRLTRAQLLDPLSTNSL